MASQTFRRSFALTARLRCAATKNTETEAVWDGRVVQGLPGDIQPVARRKHGMLHAAQNVQDLRVSEAIALKRSRDRQGQHSIRINDRRRICFDWQADGAYNVEIVDYH